MSVDTPLFNLSLCTGIGGLDLGLQLAIGNVRTVACVEHEAFAIEVLAEAMEAGCLDQAPIWSDVRTFDGGPWRGVVDTLTAGYPCQPFSKAGKRGGRNDPRHLWPHVYRIIGEAEPSIVFLENVPDHLSLGFRQVAQDLAGLGYAIAAGLFSAEEVGSSQERARLFAVAHIDRSGLQDTQQRRVPSETKQGLLAWSSTDELCRSLFPPGPKAIEQWREILEEDGSLAPAQSKVRLLADGLSRDRSHWLRLLGNSVVPLQAAYAFCSLWAALRHQTT